MLNGSIQRDSNQFLLGYTRKNQWCRLWTQRKIGKVASMAARTAEFCPQGDQEV